jgi:hypothetical protein
MPFDYLWQFSNYPISNNDFYEGKIQMNKTEILRFEKEINIYLTLSEEDQLFTSAEKNSKKWFKKMP